MDDLIQDEVKDFIGEMEELNGKKVCMQSKFHIPILSSLWTIVAGDRISKSDTKMVSALKLLERAFKVRSFTAFISMSFFFTSVLLFYRKWVIPL